MRILIVDDHTLFREGLVSLLNGQPDIQVVAQAESVQEAVILARTHNPNLVLMDFGLPDGTGLDATVQILADQATVKIVFLTIHEDDENLFAAIRAGAKGYLLKNVPTTKLLAYLRGVQHGEAALAPVMTAKLLDEFARLPVVKDEKPISVEILSARELEVWEQLCAGATNREIAARLSIAENTVKNHVHSVLSKLDLNNRRQVVKYQ